MTLAAETIVLILQSTESTLKDPTKASGFQFNTNGRTLAGGDLGGRQNQPSESTVTSNHCPALEFAAGFGSFKPRLLFDRIRQL